VNSVHFSVEEVHLSVCFTLFDLTYLYFSLELEYIDVSACNLYSTKAVGIFVHSSSHPFPTDFHFPQAGGLRLIALHAVALISSGNQII
jgi:hypothetical protein